MKLILSPKDTTCNITLDSVTTYFIEGPTLAVGFENGRIRNYPLNNLWYYESTMEGHIAEESKA